jgi:hypothetical protein
VSAGPSLRPLPPPLPPRANLPSPRPPPLVCAARRSYRNAAVAAWLLQQGARVDLVDAEGDSALMACEDPACADLLLAAGADLLHANSAGHTALHVAVWECRDEMEAWLRAQYAQRGVAPPEVGENPEGGDADAGADEGDAIDAGGDDDGQEEEVGGPGLG